MRRRLLMAAALLPVGAIVSILVAWRCTVAPTEVSDWYDPGQAAELWTECFDGPLPEDAVGARMDAPGTTCFMVGANDGTHMCWETRAGWPFRCLEHRAWAPDPASLDGVGSEALWIIPQGLPWASEEVPVAVRPLGLAIDSVVFAALAWGGLFAVTRVRRRARIDRGTCPSCAHPQPPGAAGLVTCPECGHRWRRDPDRPRQLLRAWMIPLMLPQAASLAWWFFSRGDVAALRGALPYEPWLTAASGLSVAAAATWIGAIAYGAYADRPGPSRWALSVGAGVVLATTAWAAIFAMAVLAFP